MTFPIFRNFWTQSYIRGEQLINIMCTGQSCLQKSFHAIASLKGNPKIITQPPTQEKVSGNCWALVPVRTNIRNNFPRPRETKRQKMNFWNRMKTRGGRMILMRRYLKGRHVLSH